MKRIVAFFRFLRFSLLVKGFHARKLSFIGYKVEISCKNQGYINCHGKIRLDNYSELQSYGKMTLGNHLVLNKFSRIIALDSIEIGENVTIARFVSILDHDHSFIQDKDGSLMLKGYKTAPIKIGNNVWIGDKVSITKGVTIGDNVIVGANSVVTKDIPSNCISAGVPCKVVKKLI
ncbi:MAG: acyltransferase [Candidatus Hydrogenedentota bacterium]